ncbi:DeoR/GlpR family DNA-binding transcription regulator [Pseudarthrobacter sp. AG30]|uniref:DeoR/GlpR family DNA-binding transcription regulator n=1 Tax=Pseudarthrobacter sp. AG30 TaxID=2249742 RepID=UPI001980A99C|nr:DeoR/GlpR family DNA-binding transcription regulator [Pseudarthrobacter sp. AG30]
MNQTARPLIPEQRHQEILRLLQREGVLSIRSLTDYMNVSHMTVRRDITALEDTGQVVSVQGGVRLAKRTGQTSLKGRELKARRELPRKQAIAELAAQFVEDDMVVFLDSGTTCQSLVPHLGPRRNLTVVTNNFYVVNGLFTHPHIEVIHTGGAVDPNSGSSEGRLAADAIKSVNIDRSFLSTETWDISRGVTSSSMDKVEVKLATLQASTSCFLLADSTKFGTISKFRVAAIDQLDAVVTDEQLSHHMQENIRDRGVAVYVAALRKRTSTGF